MVEGKMSLPSEYEKQRDEKLDHPCRQTCSGWQQGFERGEEKANVRAEKRIQELEETHRMQLAAITTASLCNTEKSMKDQLIGKENPYWTVAYDDVITAVKREMELEQKLTSQEQLNQKLAEGNSVLYKQKAELEKQVQGLVEALEFYSDVSNLIEQCPQYCPEFSDVAMRALSNYQAAREKK